MIERLAMVSLLPAHQDDLVHTVAKHLQAKLNVPIDFERQSWNESFAQLKRGGAHLAWMPAINYVHISERQDITPIASPVPEAERYEGRAHFYFDVLIAQENLAQQCRIGILEFDFSSSLNAVQNWSACSPYLKSIKDVSPYHSLRAGIEDLHAGKIDALVVNSYEVDENDERLAQIKTWTSIGPYPTPPITASGQLPIDFKELTREALIGMNLNKIGERHLGAHGISHFAGCDDFIFNAARILNQIASVQEIL